MESLSDSVASFPADCRIRTCRARDVFRERGFVARSPQMVQGRVGGDSPGPGLKIALRFEPGSMFVDAPERFHSQILSDASVANDADNPGIYLPLALPEQHLEGVQVARREPFQ